MKYLIASDIHGSREYCARLLNSYENEKADKLILLGDLLYHGPRNNLPDSYDTKAVAQMLNQYKNRILCVRGNCDTEVDQMVLDFPVLADYALLELCGKTVFITHGHLFNENKLPPLSHGDILLHGHTHVPKCDDKGDYVYMNPGSVSIPKEQSHHGYMTLCDGVFRWKNFDGQEMLPPYSV